MLAAMDVPESVSVRMSRAAIDARTFDGLLMADHRLLALIPRRGRVP